MTDGRHIGQTRLFSVQDSADNAEEHEQTRLLSAQDSASSAHNSVMISRRECDGSVTPLREKLQCLKAC